MEPTLKEPPEMGNWEANSAYVSAVQKAIAPVTRYENTTAGPASRAAVPVVTKIPAAHKIPCKSRSDLSAEDLTA